MPSADFKPFCDPATPPSWVRPRPFRIEQVDLDIAIDLDAQSIVGTVTHRCVRPPHAAPGPLELDQHDIEILSVALDGVKSAFHLAPGTVVIPWPAGLETAAVTVVFRTVKPAKGMYFVAADPAKNHVAMCWTQGAMEDHSYWFPCFDTPNNLSTYRVVIRHRSNLHALANGVCEKIVDGGDGWSTTTFIHDRPHVLYLLNVAVGDFVGVVDQDAPVPITNWLPRIGGDAVIADRATTMFRATAFAVRWFDAFLDTPYAWARYGHVVVHRFMWGGMENTTLTTITDRVLMDAAVVKDEDVWCDDLVIHELAHQWFGDLMTMKGWADIWLNESFATYLEARCTAAFHAHRAEGIATENVAMSKREAEELELKLWIDRKAYLEEDSGHYRRALVTNRYGDPYELFDRVAYEKGALVLHTLRCHLGEERFRAAVALYVGRHAHDLVETADFRQACEDATGEPLDWFFAQWVHRAGHPRVKVRHRHDAIRGLVVIDLEQTQAGADAVTQIDNTWRLGFAIAWPETVDGKTTVTRKRIEFTRARDTVVFPCTTAPAWVAADPAGEILAEWDEGREAAEMLARIAEAGLEVTARARAAAVLGGVHPTDAVVAGLVAAAATGHPELLRAEAIGGLGGLRDVRAVAALQSLYARTPEPRLRRSIARALGRAKGLPVTPALAEWLLTTGDQECAPGGSRLVAGDLFSARGALDVPGVPAAMRPRMGRPSWNHRLRAGAIRALGHSAEAAACDDVLGILNGDEPDAVLQAACAAAAELGREHPQARPRIGLALARLIDNPGMGVRFSAAGAIARLGDPERRGALASRLAREGFGHLRRALREALADLDRQADVGATQAAMTRRIDELERVKLTLEQRLDALEKRLSEAPKADATKPEAKPEAPQPTT
jgi:aminopeptidase N